MLITFSRRGFVGQRHFVLVMTSQTGIGTVEYYIGYFHFFTIFLLFFLIPDSQNPTASCATVVIVMSSKNDTACTTRVMVMPSKNMTWKDAFGPAMKLYAYVPGASLWGIFGWHYHAQHMSW